MNKDFVFGLALSTLALHSTANSVADTGCDFDLTNREAWIVEYSPTISCSPSEIVLSLPNQQNDTEQLSLSFNAKGELLEKIVQIDNGSYRWSFRYHSSGALASMTYPSGATGRYTEVSPLNSLMTTILATDKHNIAEASDINPRYQNHVLASLPLGTDEGIYRSTEILQDLLGIAFLDDYEYMPAIEILRIRGLVNSKLSTYYAHFSASKQLLALSNSEGEILSEFVYQSGELSYEIRHKVLHASTAVETEERVIASSSSRKPIIVSTTITTAVDTTPAISSSGITAGVSLDLSNRSFHQGKTQAIHNQIDSDKDGLPDLWEQLYFATLERDGRGDFDQDGRSDRAEFLRNSNPKLKLDGTRHRNSQSQLNALLHQM